MSSSKKDRETKYGMECATKEEQESLGIDWWTKLILKLFPKYGIKSITKRFGMDFGPAERAEALFRNTKRIDIFPMKLPCRGFQIVLDNSTSLFFYQDGDHFVYDGFEIGEYEGGEVTVFDNLS